jgi:hypothetical protein
MWKYSQSTGELFNPGGDILDTGYAGKGSAKNNPDNQCVADTGPIPRGFYDVQPAVKHLKLGPVAIPLSPDGNNDMCGRSGFFIHGDSVSDPGNASEGCIIMKRATREEVNASGDKRFQVVRRSLLSTASYRAARRLSAKRRAANKKRTSKRSDGKKRSLRTYEGDKKRENNR